MKKVHRTRQAAVQLKNIDLNLLVILDDLHKTRSTTTTARRLGRTQSAISHALGRLRDVFDEVRAGYVLLEKGDLVDVYQRKDDAGICAPATTTTGGGMK